uniref:Uncharacterized protein n=1 Tax=Elaeophora elaphi TaxID=1147741 RepID=A0A0R3RPV7_9BILA
MLSNLSILPPPFLGFFSAKIKGKSYAPLGAVAAGGIVTNACRGTTVEIKNSKLAISQNNDETGKVSGLMKPKNSSSRVSRKIPAATPVVSGTARDMIKVLEINLLEYN